MQAVVRTPKYRYSERLFRKGFCLKSLKHFVLGQNYVLRAGQSATVRLNAGTTLLVYGRGIVPLTMGYWISDALFVDHDPILATATILTFLKGKLWK